MEREKYTIQPLNDMLFARVLYGLATVQPVDETIAPVFFYFIFEGLMMET